MSEESVAEQKAAVSARARDFDLRALLRVLFALGYSWDTLLFEGVRTLPEGPGIVHSVEFLPGSSPYAVLRLWTGLLGPNGPLPSYFGRFADSLDDPRAFLAFIRFFDHVLLRDWAYTVYPDLGAARLEDGAMPAPSLAMAYRIAAGFDSVPQLHALFRAVVPELPASVVRRAFVAHRPESGARFGTAALDGSAILGPRFRTTTRGYLVLLHAEDECDDRDRPWEDVVAERWEHTIRQALGRLRARVELRIAFDTYGSAAQLAHTAQMGRRRIRTREPSGWEVLVATSEMAPEEERAASPQRLRAARPRGG